MSRVLVTGATGFLGRHLCRVLKLHGDEITAVGSKKWDDICCLKLGANFDYIYHLAAYTQGGDWCLTHAGEQWLANQKINTDILMFWKKHSPRAKFITIGTSCAYVPSFNQVESDYLRGEPHESLFVYAMVKRMLLMGCEALHKQFGLNYLYIVPSTVYGTDYHVRNDRQLHFIFDLVRKIIRGKELGEQVILWGDGNQHRELVYIDDFVETLLKLKNANASGIFNIGGEDGTIRHFAEEICRQVGYNHADVIYDETKFVGAPVKVLNKEKTESVLGKCSQFPVSDGIHTLIEWYYATGVWK